MVAKNTPSLPVGVDRQTRLAIEKLGETLDTGTGLRGSPEERFIRVGDLLDMNLARRLGSAAQRLVSGQNLISSSAPILDIPPRPENLEVSGGIGNIFLTWNNARLAYSNHELTEIWRATVNNVGVATMVGQTTTSFLYVDPDVSHTLRYYYWIRFVSSSNITGPYNSTSGTLGNTKQDPAELLALLQDEITETQLYAALNDRINLIDAAGTGLVDKVQDLETVFGSVSTAAASAAAAALSEAAAIAAAVEALNQKNLATIQAGNSFTSATNSETSKVAAQTASSNASTSATNAATSATSSAGSAASSSTSATNAANSATASGNSASAASTSATNASTSATAAGTSASAANTSKLSAQTEAANAATSATNSASSATTSAGSAASASNSATNSATSALDSINYAAAANISAAGASTYSSLAGGSASAANTSATNAATSASNAGTSATNASNSATNAAGSSSSASTSATAAATSATNSANSATASAGSASSAATSATNSGNSATASQASRVAAETARDTAQGHASAASTSATNASASATAAGTSASSASTSSNTASTAASDALTYRHQAATSATDAQGYATASAVDYTAVNARLNNAGGTGVTVEQKLVATASDVGGLGAQYTLKIDNNGMVSGFGLSSEVVNGQPNSYFIVNADKFGITSTSARQRLQSLTRSGSVASASTDGINSVVSSGQKVVISNIYDDGWNGVWDVASSFMGGFTFNVPTSIAANPVARMMIHGRGVSSLTRSGTTATAAMQAAHPFVVGQEINIVGADDTLWNDRFTITSVPSSTSFTFTVGGSFTTPAVASIYAAKQTIPFVVANGKVVMDGAYIKDASIGTAAIGNASITTAKIATLNASVITAGTITTDRIQIGAVSSINQQAGNYSVVYIDPAATTASRTDTLMTIVVTGAPIYITARVNVFLDQLASVPFGLTSNTKCVSVAVNLLIDGSEVVGVSELYSVKKISSLSSPESVWANMPISSRTTLSAGSHIIGIRTNVAFYDASGGFTATCAYFSVSAFCVAEENKV
jgi:hypothetical protein